MTMTSEQTAVTFDTAKTKQTSASSPLAVHIAGEKKEGNKKRGKKKKKEEKKGSLMEIGHGFTDSQVEPDSCKLATPQFRTSGTLPLIIISEVIEIFLPPCNWNY